MLDIATTMSASIHTLTGSSQPGAVAAFVPVTPTWPTSTYAGMATCGHADEKLIELAERVKALARRDHHVWDRLSKIEDAADDAMPAQPQRPEAPARGTLIESESGGARTTTFSIPTTPDPAHEAAMAAYEAAAADYARGAMEMKVRLGHSLWEKLSRRTFRRLVRWAEQLTGLEPISQAGLAAKAAALLAVQETGNYDQWVTDLATAVSRDALRIATALAAEEHPDAELMALASAWDASCTRCDVTCAAYDEAADRLQAVAIPIPEVLFRTERDHRLLGPYGSVHLPSGRRWYGDPSSIEGLRKGGSTAAGEERRFEIVQAYDRWEAEKRAAEASTGYAAALATDEEAGDENRALRRRILALPARTMEGILLKVRVARWCFANDEDEIIAHLASEAKNAPATGETAAFSILLDLARMLPDAAQAKAPQVAERSAA